MRRGARTPLRCGIVMLFNISSFEHTAHRRERMCWTALAREIHGTQQKAPRSHRINDAVRSRGLIALHANIACAHMREHTGKCMGRLSQLAPGGLQRDGSETLPLHRPRPEATAARRGWRAELTHGLCQLRVTSKSPAIPNQALFLPHQAVFVLMNSSAPT